MTGRTEGDNPCPVCTEAKEFFEDKQMDIPAEKFSFTETQIDSPEGEKKAEEKKIKSIPFIEDCKTFQTDDCTTNAEGRQECKPKTETKCRTITGYDENDWRDLDELKTVEPAKTETETTEAPKSESS